MKKIIYILLLTFSAIAAHSQSTFTQPMDAMDCSNIFFKALLEEDYHTLESLLSGDFSISGFQGQEVDRNFILQAVTQGYLRIDSGMLSGTRLRNYDDVGVITGTWSARGQLQNNSFQNDLTYMVVCVKAGGNWKVSAVQFTPVR